MGVESLVGPPHWRHKGVSNTHGYRKSIRQREDRLVRWGPESLGRRGRGKSLSEEGGVTDNPWQVAGGR